MKTQKILLFTLGLFFILFSCKEDKPAIPEPKFGTMTDIEGNTYKTVKIGDQEWMAENLKSHKLNDGTPIAYVTADVTWSDVNSALPMMCYYDNDVDKYKDKYGALYNFYAVQTGKLAPQGWHIPTDADWQKLQDYLIAHGYNYDGTTSGNKIAKSLASTTNWDDKGVEEGEVGHNPSSNNKSGFNGYPVGNRNKLGIFKSFTTESYWWAADKVGNEYGADWGFLVGGTALQTGGSAIRTGYPVRCVKNINN